MPNAFFSYQTKLLDQQTIDLKLGLYEEGSWHNRVNIYCSDSSRPSEKGNTH